MDRPVATASVALSAYQPLDFEATWESDWSSMTRMLTITASKDKTANLTLTSTKNCILMITVDWQSENYNKKCDKNKMKEINDK